MQYVCVRVFTPVHVPEANLGCHSSDTVPLLLEIGWSLTSLGLVEQVGSRASKHQECSGPSIPSAGVTTYTYQVSLASFSVRSGA